LDHGKSLMVLTTRNFEDVTFVLVGDETSVNFLAHSLVIEESPIR